MSNQITFAGVTIATPKTFKVAFKDLDSDSTNRNTKGVLHRDRIRGAMRTLSFEWGPLTMSQISAILQAISPTGVDVYYPDPMDGEWETRHVYAGDRAVEGICDLSNLTWDSLAFDLVEQ